MRKSFCSEVLGKVDFLHLLVLPQSLCFSENRSGSTVNCITKCFASRIRMV